MAVKTTVTELPESRVRVRGRGPAGGGRAPRPAGRAPARPPAADPRLPQGQGPAAGRHPARRPRGRARRGRARRRSALVRRRDRRRRHRPGRRADARPRRPAGRGRAADVLDRDRRAPEGQARASTRASRSAAREPDVADEAVDEEIEQLRDRSARLETVDRAAAQTATSWWSTSSADRRRAVRRRRGPRPADRARLRRLIPGFEEQLGRRTAGEAADGRRSPSPTTTAPRTCAGTTRDLRGHRQGGQGQGAARARRRLRRRAAGFDTLDELRDDIRAALAGVRGPAPSRPSSARPRSTPPWRGDRRGARGARRGRARELWDQHRSPLSHQGISPEAYLRISGKRRSRSSTDAKPDAERALRREAVLAAIVEAEGIEPGRRRSCSRRSRTPPSARARLRRSCSSACADAGRLDALREDIAARRRSTSLAERAKPIPVEQAKAREQAVDARARSEPGSRRGRTPARAPSGLWTPGLAG